MLLLIVWIVVVVLALVVLGASPTALLGAAGRLGRELEAAERDARPLLEQVAGSSGRGRGTRPGVGRILTAGASHPTWAPDPNTVRRSIAPATRPLEDRVNLGPLEIGLIILAILLLFGYKKLPDASRSLGRSLRIFKGEMKGMKDDDVRTKDAAAGHPRPRRDRRPAGDRHARRPTT